MAPLGGAPFYYRNITLHVDMFARPPGLWADPCGLFVSIWDNSLAYYRKFGSRVFLLVLESSKSRPLKARFALPIL